MALLLATVIGFAIHRASLCNVRAVAEVLSTRRGFMLMSFFKTILWRRRTPGVSWFKLVLSDRYRLSTAAMLLGLANGAIYAFHGLQSRCARLRGDASPRRPGVATISNIPVPKHLWLSL